MRFSIPTFVVAAPGVGFGAWLLLTGMVRSAAWMQSEGNARGSWLLGVPLVLFFAAVLTVVVPFGAALVAKLIKAARFWACFGIGLALQLGFCALCYAILARTSARHLTWAVLLAVLDALLLGVVAAMAQPNKTYVVMTKE